MSRCMSVVSVVQVLLGFFAHFSRCSASSDTLLSAETCSLLDAGGDVCQNPGTTTSRHAKGLSLLQARTYRSPSLTTSTIAGDEQKVTARGQHPEASEDKKEQRLDAVGGNVSDDSVQLSGQGEQQPENGEEGDAAHAEEAHVADPDVVSTIRNALDEALKAEVTEANKSVESNDTATGKITKVAAEVVSRAEQDALSDPEVKAAIADDVKDRIDKEVHDAIDHKHRLPTPEELEHAVHDEMQSIWDVLQHHRKYAWNQTRYDLSGGSSPESFFKSAPIHPWLWLVVTFCLSLAAYRFVTLDLPTSYEYHMLALLGWFAVGAVYWCVVYVSMGSHDTSVWTVGYLLEMIGSLENVFAFHVVVQMFDLSSHVVKRVLFLLMLCQLVFQMVFYMGLATWLRSLHVVPYILGAWLMYAGYLAALQDESGDMQIKLHNILSNCLGDRMLPSQADNGALITRKDDKLFLHPSGVLLLCLLVVDFLLEVDVTVTKIESYRNEYLCFSSSLVASFAMPEIFFVAEDLFHRFPDLKYGISAVLVFLGLQALLHFYVQLSPLMSIAVITILMVGSVLICLARERIGKARERAAAAAEVASGTTDI